MDRVRIASSGKQSIDSDGLLANFPASTATKPSQAALDALFERTRAVRVLDGGTCQNERHSQRLLAETSEPTEIVSLRETLRFVEPGDVCHHCMCCGDPTLEFVASDGSRLAIISIHHGRSIRWPEWQSDVTLVDGLPLMEWLADRRVAAPGEEFARDLVMERTWENDRLRWRAAMPRALDPIWPAAENWTGMYDIAPLRAALESELPDEHSRIRALLEWFGAGAGPWSGFPAYESVAERLLLEYPTPAIVGAIEAAPTTYKIREGAARLFAGWDFEQQRPGDHREIPGHLKRLLWVHSKYTQDDDKRARARFVFAMYGWRARATRTLARYLQ